MKISEMRQIKGGGKLKASFRLETPKMDINDCKLIENDKGVLWAAMYTYEYTNKQTNEKKWKPIVYIKDRVLLDKISDLAREEYERLFGTQPAPRQGESEEDIPF